MSNPRLTSERLLLVVAASVSVSLAAAAEAGPPRFETDILPVLKAHCVQCHGREAVTAGLDLRTPALIRKGGSRGPTVVPGSAAESLLYKRIVDESMPPGDALKLLPEQKETIRRWIDAGMPASRTYEDATVAGAAAPTISEEARSFWSFRKLSQPQLPAIADASRVRTTVDRFLLEKLEKSGLNFSPDAKRATLIRRAYLDLTGLPPSLAETEEFLADRIRLV